ncbi:AbrB family transcriptional regulator [Pseudomonas folii]
MMKTILLLSIAAVAGLLLEFCGFPQGILIGSLLASALAFSKLRVTLSLRFGLGYVQIVLGISTGLVFASWGGQEAFFMLPSLFFLLLCLILQVAVSGCWLLKVERWTLKDSLLAVYPGALAAVFDLLESAKASNKVMVVHVIRLLTITVLVSLCIPGDASIVKAHGRPLDLEIALILLSLTILSLLLGRLLMGFGVPAPFMLMAIITTGISIKLGYLHGFKMPQWSLDLAAVILGVLIGSKFKDINFSDIVSHGRAGFLSVALMLLVAAVFASSVGWILESDPFSLWLAYMPGAIETIAIVAFSSGLNIVFILSHHLVRMILLHFAPALIVRLRR